MRSSFQLGLFCALSLGTTGLPKIPKASPYVRRHRHSVAISSSTNFLRVEPSEVLTEWTPKRQDGDEDFGLGTDATTPGPPPGPPPPESQSDDVKDSQSQPQSDDDEGDDALPGRDDLVVEQDGVVVSAGKDAPEKIRRKISGNGDDNATVGINNTATATATEAKLSDLQAQKKAAVAREDYIAAEKLKEEIGALKKAAAQADVEAQKRLASLETQKKAAVAKEDYIAAEKFKEEIGEIQGSLKSKANGTAGAVDAATSDDATTSDDEDAGKTTTTVDPDHGDPDMDIPPTTPAPAPEQPTTDYPDNDENMNVVGPQLDDDGAGAYSNECPNPDEAKEYSIVDTEMCEDFCNVMKDVSNASDGKAGSCHDHGFHKPVTIIGISLFESEDGDSDSAGDYTAPPYCHGFYTVDHGVCEFFCIPHRNESTIRRKDMKEGTCLDNGFPRYVGDGKITMWTN